MSAITAFHQTASSLKRLLQRMRRNTRDRLDGLQEAKIAIREKRRRTADCRRLMTIYAEMEMALDRNVMAHAAPKDERRR